jgi:peptidyl-prolyl cis-trans isomerase A (cyclophilin A)
MNRRRFALASAAAVAALPARAQAPQPTVELTTPLGAIRLALAADKAPITAANFLRYVDARLYDGAAFYRAMKLAAAPPAGLVQGGLNGRPGALPPIAHEPTIKTGLRHVDGTLSMARYDPGTAASEFFVCVGDIPSLDADPSQSGDNQGFAAFGHVLAGMDAVRRILLAPTGAGGEGAMKGQMLSPPIQITSARRV